LNGQLLFFKMSDWFWQTLDQGELLFIRAQLQRVQLQNNCTPNNQSESSISVRLMIIYKIRELLIITIILI